MWKETLASAKWPSEKALFLSCDVSKLTSQLPTVLEFLYYTCVLYMPVPVTDG